MQLETVLLPGKGVIVAVVVCQTVRTLAVVSDKTKFIAAGADDDAVVGTKGERHLTFLFCAEGDVLDGIVVVTGGLQMTDTSFKTALDLTEMTAVAEYSRLEAYVRPRSYARSGNRLTSAA